MSCPRLAGGGSGRRRRWPGPMLDDRRGPRRQRLHPRPGRPTSPTGSSCARGAVAPAGQRHGWAGPYLAKTSGCPAALTDPPVGGRRSAAARARVEDLTGRRGVVVAASGAHPPFRAEALRLLPGEGGHSTVKGWPGSHRRSRRPGGADNITAAPRHCEGNAARPLAILNRPVDDFCPGPARFCTDADPAQRYRERNLIGRRHRERFGEPPAIIRRAPGRRTPCPADVAGGRLTPSTPQEG
jgi:hypothetical protein